MTTDLGTQPQVITEGEGFVVSPESAIRCVGPQGRETDVTEVLARREQTGARLGLFRQTIAPESGPPAHRHRTTDEFFYVVSGTFRFELGARVASATAGSFVFIPRGTVHSFRNVGAELGVLVVGVTPGGFEGIFAERQGVDAETNRALMARFDTEVVVPPLG